MPQESRNQTKKKKKMSLLSLTAQRLTYSTLDEPHGGAFGSGSATDIFPSLPKSINKILKYSTNYLIAYYSWSKLHSTISIIYQSRTKVKFGWY